MYNKEMSKKIKNIFFLLLLCLVLYSCSIGGTNTSSTNTASTSVSNPLLPYQWYYENTGQTSFAGIGGTPNKDLNISSVHSQGITGKNIKIMILDDGLDMNHEDLKTQRSHSYDVITRSDDPTPTRIADAHGTSVAGIINMQDNNLGGLGVAPGSTLLGVNFLHTDVPSYISGLDELNKIIFYAHGLTQSPTDGTTKITNIAEIYNNSWGSNSCAPSEFDNTIYGYYKNGAIKGRDNKGYVYVKAAGNGFSRHGTCNCANANNNGLSCHNSSDSTGPYDTISQFIIVGASNADGEISSYSSHGSNLWISAPAGEIGAGQSRSSYLESLLATVPDYFYKPAMVTTDPSGCDIGYSTSNITAYTVPLNDFNYRITFYGGNAYKVGPHSLNSNCNYNSTMNGTSAATPVISGVVALILEANPNLTWRDIKHILAISADNNIYIPTKSLNVNGSDVIVKSGWITNKTGYKFSNTYGFGIINVALAISNAKNYTANTWGDLTSITATNSTSADIPIKNATGVTSNATINQDLTIEHVRIEVNTPHTNVENLLISIISPQGTESIVYWPKSSLSGHEGGFTNFSMASNAFYGENANGTWKLKIVDVGSSSSADDSKLTSWKIEINGH